MVVLDGHFQKLLGANGASKVSAYVTHAVFPKRSWERFEHGNGGEKVFTYLFSFL
jgi:phosphoribosylpyrophosphate synthetase